MLTERWNTLEPHVEQSRLWRSTARFRVVPAGRRSGKTELAKRYGILQALKCQHENGWYVYGAPTHMQAKRIFWKDLKSLIPRGLMAGRPSEGELTIRLINGAEITVLGLDAPERVEGRPLDWICADEYGNCKASVWEENLRPALSTRGRPGGGWLIGVPEGRNHYHERAVEAQKESQPDWDYFHWKSADILDPEEMEAARRELDELTFAQEYEASFVNYAGRAYYGFSREENAAESLAYNPSRPLAFCFDFNVSPAIAVVVQELDYEGQRPAVGEVVTAVIGEVYIPRNGNTPAVCRKLLQDWGQHEGDILCYGDATGGAKGTAKVRGSDWDIIRQELKPVFQERLKMRVPRANPRERVRVNAMNSRLRAASGEIRLLVDPIRAPYTVNDLEGCIFLVGGAGELDKSHPNLTHLTDALGYYVEKLHPVHKVITRAVTV